VNLEAWEFCSKSPGKLTACKDWQRLDELPDEFTFDLEFALRYYTDKILHLVRVVNDQFLLFRLVGAESWSQTEAMGLRVGPVNQEIEVQVIPKGDPESKMY